MKSTQIISFISLVGKWTTNFYLRTHNLTLNVLYLTSWKVLVAYVSLTADHVRRKQVCLYSLHPRPSNLQFLHLLYF